MFQRHYSLNKSRNILKWSYQWYEKNWSILSQEELKTFENHMETLDHALQSKDKKEASRIAKKLEEWSSGRIKTSPFHYIKEIVIALAVALALATVVRMTVFELYKIPTGSMRPTYKEEDLLVVSKTTHGINIPLVTDHFYFDPDKVIRGNPVIWTGDKLDIPNNDSKYFWIFPSKKRYIKRLIAKPGDTVYFYGGKIYSLDRKGQPINELLTAPRMEKLEYIPFSIFEGKPVNVKPDNAGIAQQVLFLHFNRPVGRVTYNWLGTPTGEVKTDQGWVKDAHYYDQLGLENFAMARLLNPGQLNALYPLQSEKLEKTPLYLELRHHPQLKEKPLSHEDNRRQSPVSTEVSIIPLSKTDIDKIMDAMYTARFDIVNHKARLYSESPRPFNSFSPTFPGVDDGTYEFYFGKLFQIGFKGMATELPKSNPLYSRSPENVQKLFNLGTNFSEIYSPSQSHPFYQPSRYAYYRNGDLYVMGSPVFKKDDTALLAFVAKEKKKSLGFVDQGTPSKETIKKFGLKIPEGHYLVLGDNHAMSADSRSFGFIPEENLEGTPSFIFWPPGPRWGFPNQTAYPYFTVSNVVVWSLVILALVIWWIIHRRNLKKPIYKKISKP